MYTEDNCPNLHCRDCKYYICNAELKDVKSLCKRIDHKKIQFAEPWFRSYDCGSNHLICKDFQPKHPEYADLKDWTNFEDYWPVYVKTWLPYGNENITLSFILNGDKSIRYKVQLKDFINGTMLNENGDLKAIEKSYYKRVRPDEYGYGYKLINEPLIK